jgi:HlyD family secretion protein
MSSRRWIVLALAAGTLLLRSSAALTQPPLEASGIIEAEEVRLASEFQGYITQVNVHAGGTVSAGQVVVTVESSSIGASVDEAQAALEAAEAERAEVRAAPRAEVVAGLRAQLAVAQAQQAAALAARTAAEEEARESQSLQEQILAAETQAALARQSVEVAAADQAEAQSAADASPWNTPQRHVLELQAVAATANMEAARADLHTAEVVLEHLRAMRDKPLALQALAHAAAGDYDTATAGVRVKQAQLDQLLAGATPEELAVADAEFELAQAQLNLARTQAQRLTLRSPVTASVVECNVNVGEVALPGVTLMTVADLSHVHVLVYIPENRLGQVLLGQRVDAVTDSFPERPIEGVVTYIASTAEFTPRNLATKEGRVNTVYAVRVALSNPDGLLKPGMAADVVFRP